VPAPQTFGERADQWLETLKVEHSTRIGYQRTLDRYWRPQFGGAHLTAIRPTDIREVLAPLAAKTMNNNLIPLRRILAAAMDDGVIKENPALRIHNAKVQTQPPDPLTMDEVERVPADLATRVDPQTANYFEVAFFTGLRPSEQIALNWMDCARKEGRLRVHRAGVGKGQAAHEDAPGATSSFWIGRRRRSSGSGSIHCSPAARSSGIRTRASLGTTSRSSDATGTRASCAWGSATARRTRPGTPSRRSG
jgi:integrase